MADDKTPEPVTLVAVERGFAMGRMVEPGTQFMWRPVREDGSKRRMPKWAALPSDPRINKPKPAAGDLKPKDAQAAVRKKAAVGSVID